MKKLNTFLYACALLGTGVVSLTSCNPTGGETQTFSFTVSLKNHRVLRLYVGDTDDISISPKNEPEDACYTFTSRKPTVLRVDASGKVTAVSAGRAEVLVREETTREEASLTVEVINASEPANGGYNYSSAASAEDIAKRTEILGKLEQYAVDSHLTGITLFENGGLVKYSKRVQPPTTNYVTGYGFGILTEGYLDGQLASQEIPVEYRDFYQSAQTSNPNEMNAWNAQGSAVSDLAGYISSSYWGTRLDENHTKVEWYPVLAADTYVDSTGATKPNNRPIAVKEEGDTSKLSRKWKIYVKTDESMRKQGKHLYMHSTRAGFENVPVTLADYEFAYRLLLTGKHNLFRGTEMAGDETYGIKGAFAYNARTKASDDNQALATWEAMKASNELGIHTGTDIGGDYIELEIINDIDDFTAMYTLSSSLVSPVPESFIKAISRDGSLASGLDTYGKQLNDNKITDRTIGCGPFRLTKFEATDNGKIIFELNDEWFEKTDKRYLIPGVCITTYNAATSDDLWTQFEAGKLDSCGVPQSQVDKVKSDEIGNVLRTKGDSTFKLNVNACTQERWDELFGKNGKIAQITNPDPSWKAGEATAVKPWMSNENFLSGLYWSIDRKTFADNRGVNPAIDYFSSAYLSDPENGFSYNDSDEHKAVIAKYQDMVPEIDDQGNPTGNEISNYGYNPTRAKERFSAAMDELVGDGAIVPGTAKNPKTIHVTVAWMNPDDVTEYGAELKGYVENVFNGTYNSATKEYDDPAYEGIKLDLVQIPGTTNYEDVYDKMRTGQFDLAFGAISGNTYSPLNFLEVLKSDNSSGFTLNWGKDTSVIDEENPIQYDGKTWSFDALWECADRGGVVYNGSPAKIVQSGYVESGLVDKFNNGQDHEIVLNLKFIDVAGVDIEIKKVVCYVVGGDNSNNNLPYVIDGDKVKVTLSKEKAAAIEAQIGTIINKEKQPGDDGYVDVLFSSRTYGTYFEFEVYYELKITGFSSSESIVSIAEREDLDNR